ncbi:MAG: hypothetical protein LC798_11070 [Chloroflexi bacterium]|nr:hypothetical protein [Chloroflexota bacterium]
MSLVVLADAQERSGAQVTQAMLDEEEAWLTARIGPLTDERTETFFLPKPSTLGTVDAVYLSRRTDEVDGFTSDGTALDIDDDWRLLSGYILERVPTGSAWTFPLVVTYTPNDEEIVKGVIYDLLAYRGVQAGLQSVRIGEYSETYATGRRDPVRTSLVARVLTGGGLGAYARPFRLSHTAIDRSLIEAVGS